MDTKQITDIYKNGLKLIGRRQPLPIPPKTICLLNNNMYRYEEGEWVKLWK